jgi:ADP-ribose pyrophosphatase YjhB (NUDIX family)
MLIQNGQVLLVRQTYISGWYLPGGGVKRGETLDEAARREAHEEIGAEMEKLKLLGTYTHFGQHKSDHNALFLSTDFTLSGKHDKEIAEAQFFSLDALPDELLEGHRKRLEEYRKGVEIPQFGEW